ncbi:MAG: hypothetical protein LC772_06535 [Chloroflexi bacterium]|nr:hypothetical protein [Chloroflexota bacterium]
MVTRGKRGRAPDWVPLLEAAIYMGVPVWDLEKQPACWRDRALVLKSAHAKAEKHLSEMQKHHW